ncbi:MAG TPA: acetyltransferase [Thermoanaerobaculia bacterium]|jgi:sugar O-acyltransferase (sialic acid O-acetyltransferase NeuD family)|nr:acetyltransferase [Thermoanaerobaculia bacterium]
MAKVVVFGVSQWATLAHFYLTHDSPHDVVGFTVDREYMTKERHHDLPVVAFDEVDRHYPPEHFEMFLPISFKQMNRLRAAKYAEAKARGYRLISYVSSRSTVWPGFRCGDNCFIFEDNTIQPFVEIGNDVVLWSGNHLGHHSVVADHVTITSHVVVSGCCTIGPYSFLGTNATVRDGVSVARDTLVGAGVVIQRDTREGEAYRTPNVEPLAFTSLQVMNASYRT